MAVTEVEVDASVQVALRECVRRGLVVRSERELGGQPGSRHYHLASPDRSGTLELSELHGRVWFSFNERRDTGWVLSFAHDVVAALSTTT